MSLTIVPIDDSDVSVDLFDPAIHPSLAGFLEGPEKSTPYALVLTNNLPQPIVGLTVRWIRTDDQENRPVATIRSDSFLYSRSPIVPAKGHLLVTPPIFKRQGLRERISSAQHSELAGSTTGLMVHLV